MENQYGIIIYEVERLAGHNQLRSGKTRGERPAIQDTLHRKRCAAEAQMNKTTTQEERQMIKLVEKLPFPDEDKNNWAERVRHGEMSNELADEVRQKLLALDEEENQAARTRCLAELTMIVKRWRLSSQSRNFAKK
jgi:hypothetical protein